MTLDHGRINSHIGMIGDPMTKLIMRPHAGENASTFPATLGRNAPSQPAGASGAAPAEEPLARFERSYVPGTRDANGRFMGGTEAMRLVLHAGMLFAGNGF